jgi:hypothetical protein
MEASQPENLLYRFSVKCDRETNARIEKAAKKVGMTPTSFVQKHFEMILISGPTAVPPPETPQPVDNRLDFDTAKSLGITVGPLRLLRVMNKAKDGNGNLQISYRTLAEMAGVAPNSVDTFQKKLVRRGLIKQVQAPGHSRPAIWHVFPVGSDI